MSQLFGKMPTGEAVYEYTLASNGITVSVIPYGARLTHYVVDGVDVMCGYDTIEDYIADDSSQGAVVGRYGNRIRDGILRLNGKTYQLTKNSAAGFHIHGGKVGFARRLWTVEEATDNSILLSIDGFDGEEGYPGNVHVTLRYSLIDGALVMDYGAKSDVDTILNVTNHAYFNLGGCDGRTVLDHTATIYADTICEVDEKLVCTGKYLPVDGTAYDFRTPHTFGERISGTTNGGGYDNHYVFPALTKKDIAGFSLPLVAKVTNDHLTMELYTDRPGVQLYTSCALKGKPDFRGGVPRVNLGAFCLETQVPADSPNLTGEGILRANEEFRTVTVYRISAAK